MSAPICVAYPTIMDGLVLRWWLNESDFQAGYEIASASRNGFLVEPDCPASIGKLADSAHSYLAVAYHGRFCPKLDVSRWVTHRIPRAFSDELEPVAAPQQEQPAE